MEVVRECGYKDLKYVWVKFIDNIIIIIKVVGVVVNIKCVFYYIDEFFLGILFFGYERKIVFFF